eukprot:scaffold10253_cov124-Isochrysis_galbana.AAC.8
MGTRMPRWLKSTLGRGPRRQPKSPGVRGRSALVVVSFVDFRGPQWWHDHGRKHRSCNHHGLVVCWRGYGWSFAAREAVCKRLCILVCTKCVRVRIRAFVWSMAMGVGVWNTYSRLRGGGHPRTTVKGGQICIQHLAKPKSQKTDNIQHMDMAYISILTPTSSSTLTMRIATH